MTLLHTLFMSMRRLRLTVALMPVLMLAWLMVMHATVNAQPAATQPSANRPTTELDPLAGLASEDYETRCRATERLLRDDELEDAAVDDLYRRATTDEQRQRLLNVARHHLIRRMCEKIFNRASEQGAVGIYHRQVAADALPQVDRPAIEVIQVMPGFPAYGVLRSGDVIVAVNGKPLPLENITEHFQRLIQNKRRGEEITLTIQRDDERLERSFKLGSLQALKQVYLSDGVRLGLRPPFREQWQARRDALIAKGPPPHELHVVQGEK